VQMVSGKLREAWSHNTGMAVHANSSEEISQPKSNDLQVSLS